METNALWRLIRGFLRYRFDLSEDQERVEETIEAIQRGIVFKGTNLWTLIFAVFIASVGLNVNSTAVIIGAMLISPLMGPIMGVGLGVGINDFELIKKAAKNLGIMVAFSLATSTVYFLLTPLSEARSELLARTTPAVWDVLIAFFGGLAGIVGITRKEKGTTIAGVAIATALMPPLCTAGFGLATGEWYYFFGAFYLFFINAVFISFSTFLVVRLLKFPDKQFVSPEVARRVHRNVAGVVILTMLPSFYMAYNIVQKAVFEQRVQRFVQDEIEVGSTQILKTETTFGRSGNAIRAFVVGPPLEEAEMERLKEKLTRYGLEGTSLDIRQGINAQQTYNVAALRSGILEELYQRNEAALSDKNAKIELLETKLQRYYKLEAEVQNIAVELKALQPAVSQFTLNSNIFVDFQRLKPDTIPVAFIRYENMVNDAEKARLQEWLRVRIGTEKLMLIQK